MYYRAFISCSSLYGDELLVNLAFLQAFITYTTERTRIVVLELDVKRYSFIYSNCVMVFVTQSTHCKLINPYLAL